MAVRNISNMFTRVSQSYKTKIANLQNKITSIELPEKYKGTVVEKWATYWKFLLADYGEVVTGLFKEMKNKPIKATAYIGTFSGIYYCAKHNPDNVSFRNDLVSFENEVLLLGQSCRKPSTVQHLTFLERCYNHGLVRRINLGICSIIWIDNYDEACAIYKATCSYLKPQYITFRDRVVDVGFLDTWWLLKEKMEDYDVNL